MKIAERKTERDYSIVFDEIVKQTGEYCIRYNLKSLVLGLSGGLDSTVCAAIGYEVSRIYGVKLIGISLPCSSNSAMEKCGAELCGEAFCDEYIEMDLQDLYLLTKAKCNVSMGPSTDISQGNIKARLRMIMLYNAASINSGIVIDTDNLSEHYLGFWTIHGDVGDFKPLGKLWKTEVYELAKYIKDDYNAKIIKYTENLDDENNDEKEFSRWLVATSALEHAIEITPTDGNGVNSLGDMGQIAPGYTYTEVDKVLQLVAYTSNFTMPVLKDIADEYFNGDIDTVNKIVMRYLNSQFKRNKEYIGVRL